MQEDTNLTYDELARFYRKHFSLAHLTEDISAKFAVISLINIVVNKLKEKKPGVTYYQVIQQITKGMLVEQDMVTLAILCEDFGYGCKSFPDFDIKPKDMPNKIREILSKWLPF